MSEKRVASEGVGEVVINIARDFSITPGLRKRDDSEHSGQEFREDSLEQYFAPGRQEIITIVLDGVIGYPASFLEEAFGGLARKFGAGVCFARLRFESKEDPLVVEQIKRFMDSST